MNMNAEPVAPEQTPITGVDSEIITDHPQQDESLRVFRAPEGKVFRMEGSFTVLLHVDDDVMPYPASSRQKFLSTRSGREEFEEVQREHADTLWENLHEEWSWRHRYNSDYEWNKFEEWVEKNVRDKYAFQTYLHDHIDDISSEQFRFEQFIAANAYNEQTIWDELQERLELDGRYEHFPDFFEGEWLHIECTYDGMIIALYKHDRPYAQFFTYWEESRRLDGAIDWTIVKDCIIKNGQHIATFQPDLEKASITLVDKENDPQKSKQIQAQTSEASPRASYQLRSLSRVALSGINEKDTL